MTIKKNFLLGLVFLVACSSGSKTASSIHSKPTNLEGPAIQRVALLELFQANTGWRKEYIDTWKAENPVCTWYGVTCNQDGIILALSISDNNIKILPESIGKLTRLETLLIGSASLTTLPESMRNLTQLEALGLSGNKFKTLPDFLAEFKQLHYLGLNRMPELTWIVPPSLCTVVSASPLQSPHVSFERCPAL